MMYLCSCVPLFTCIQVPHYLQAVSVLSVPLFTGCIRIQVFYCLHAVSVFRRPTVYIYVFRHPTIYRLHLYSGAPLFTCCICLQVSHCLHEILDLCSTFCRLLTFQLSMSPKADRDITQLSSITQVGSSGSFISLGIWMPSVWSGKPIHSNIHTSPVPWKFSACSNWPFSDERMKIYIWRIKTSTQNVACSQHILENIF